jgi:hypothetical protein
VRHNPPYQELSHLIWRFRGDGRGWRISTAKCFRIQPCDCLTVVHRSARPCGLVRQKMLQGTKSMFIRPSSSVSPHLPDLPPGVACIVTRGFVDAILLDSGSFLKLAQSLFERHPITRVRLLDKKPLGPLMVQDGFPFGWLRQSWTEDCAVPSHWIPAQIADFMEPPRTDMVDSNWLQGRYKCRKDAQVDLSVACVRYGRTKANLPDLDAPMTGQKWGRE